MKKLSVKLLMALLLISFTTTTISAADWGLFELKGKVKSVTYKNHDKYGSPCPYRWHDDKGNEVYVVSFTKDGKVIPPKGNKITRNKRGHITMIESLCEDPIGGGTTWLYQKVARDSKERVTIITSQGIEYGGQTKFNYNSNGYINKAVDKCYGGDESTTIFSYTYESYDDYGNWTKRSIELKKEGGETETYTESREITYHEGAKKVNNATSTKESTKKDETSTTKNEKPKVLKTAKDRGLFDLYGNVKSVTYYDYSTCPFRWGSISKKTTISFSKEGKVIAPKKGTKIVRNKRGHITDIQTRYHNDSAGEYMWGSQKVKRDSKGRIFSQTGEGAECHWTLTHTYNSQGYISKSVAKGYENGDPYTIVYKYTYLEFDDNGNWTKRKCTSEGETSIETRKIVYYKTNNDKKSKDSKKAKSTKYSKKSKDSKNSKKSSSKKSKSSKSSKK